MRDPKRIKPPQPTIVRRKTAKSLAYLIERGHTPEFENGFLIPKNLRVRLGDGTFHSPDDPTHGV